ncbi:MAG: hypothetical protein M3442_20965, partial [Chloroflexota bacterium]|nr:hypothetical protein [Chloroflexota bacterium]
PLTLAPAGPGTLATAGGGTAAANAALQTVRVTIEVNKAALVGQLHAYLSDPHFSINRHPVVDDWSSAKKLNLSRALLEALLLEGDLEPHDVEQFVDGLLSGYENMVVR